VARQPTQAQLEKRPYPGKDWRAYQLSPHFTLGEFLHDQVTAPADATMRMCRHFAVSILEPLRARYGACVVVSGHRTPERNAEVGGARWSWHVWEWHPGEMGVDVTFQRGQPSEWGEAAKQGRAGGIGVYSAHLHVDSRPGRVTWSSPAA
jgi:uncharacterized protein YcbK (DUF882 family)